MHTSLPALTLFPSRFGSTGQRQQGPSPHLRKSLTCRKTSSGRTLSHLPRRPLPPRTFLCPIPRNLGSLLGPARLTGGSPLADRWNSSLRSQDHTQRPCRRSWITPEPSWTWPDTFSSTGALGSSRRSPQLPPQWSHGRPFTLSLSLPVLHPGGWPLNTWV